jgi:CDP-glucose 4,6-dehydratase
MEVMEIIDCLNIYKGKRVLVTGHTGFKGSWLSLWLNRLGAEVIGIALDPKTDNDNYVLTGIESTIEDYRVDIRDIDTVKRIVENEKPEILFHLAAQPIVLDSYSDPVYTFGTNIMGTVNLLEVFRGSSTLKTGIFVTTDKCYENLEKEYSYIESDPMGGHDPYSASKGAAELVVSSYRRSFFSKGIKKIASVRAGNVIGGGDWSSYRLMVDIVKGIEQGRSIEIRNPKAIRPWQHVLEPLGGYLLLGARMILEERFDEAWNFGPEPSNIVTVEEILIETIKNYGKGEWKDTSVKDKLHEATLLSLDITKAKKQLGWQPLMNISQTIAITVDWYKRYQKDDVNMICQEQIDDYMKLWKLNQSKIQ